MNANEYLKLLKQFNMLYKIIFNIVQSKIIVCGTLLLVNLQKEIYFMTSFKIINN